MSEQYVLDAWALLAMLQGEEPAASRVGQLLRLGERREATLLLSVINLGEVYYRLHRERGRRFATERLTDVHEAGIEVVPVTDVLVWSAAQIKAEMQDKLKAVKAALSA